MFRISRICTIYMLCVAIASSSVITAALADETTSYDEYQGWVKTYCDERATEGDVYLEAGSCSLDPTYYFEEVPGVRYKILRRGSGRAAKQGDVVVVEYLGWLFDEEASLGRSVMFDTSYKIDRRSFEFLLGARRVIPGWEKGIEGMQPGEIRELIIAPEMAYGDGGAGTVIPPKATLLFEVEMIGFANTD